MAETGRTDSVFWPVGSGRTADLGKEAGKQRDGGSGSVLEYWNRQPQRYRAVLWKAEKREAGADAGTPGRIPAADRSLTWYFQSDSGLSYLRRGQSECRTAKRRGKRRYCAASCHLERKRGDHRTEPVCKRDYSRRRI